MRAGRFRPLVAAALALPLLLTACGGDDDGARPRSESDAELRRRHARWPSSATPSRVKIGVKFDQPGLGCKNPARTPPRASTSRSPRSSRPSSASSRASIEWIETVSANREPFLQNGTVDMVVASYSINDERKQVVGLAGPYYVTGQDLLVRKDDSSITGPRALTGKKVCSVTGSTPVKTVQDEVRRQRRCRSTRTPSACEQLLNGQVDAVTTDGSILLGYAAQAAGQAQGRRQAVQRGAVRHRLQEGRHRVLRRSSTTRSRRRVRRRHLEKAFEAHARQERRARRRQTPQAGPTAREPDRPRAGRPDRADRPACRRRTRAEREVRAMDDLLRSGNSTCRDGVPADDPGADPLLRRRARRAGPRDRCSRRCGSPRSRCCAGRHRLRQLFRNTPLTLIFVLLLLRPARARTSAVRLHRPHNFGSRDRAVALHRGVRLRGDPLGHQRRAAGPGRGGPRDRA